MILQLSRRLQRKAQRQVAWIGFVNALGFGLLTGQTIYLVALLYNASDMHMGILYAAPFLAAVSAVLVPFLLNGRETTSMWSRFWRLRTFVCVCYFGLLFLSPTPLRVWLFVGLYLVFLVLRAFGMAGYFTVIRALAPPGETSTLMARSLGAGQIGVLLATMFSFWVTRRNWLGTEEWNLFLLIGVGTCFNGFTAWLISRLPQTGYLTDGSRRSLLQATVETWRQRGLREVAIVVGLHAVIAVFGGYLISYMRNVAGYSVDHIFFYTVLGVVASIAISHMLKMIGRWVRPRILLFAANGLLAVLALLWALVDLLPRLAYSVGGMATLYSLSILCVTASHIVSMQLRTGRLPLQRSVEHSIVFDLMQMLGALLALGSATLLSHFTQGRPFALHSYSLHFMAWMVVCLGICVFTFYMLSDGGGALSEFAALMPSSLFTIIRANRLEQEDNPVRRHLNLEGLLLSPNQVSRELIMENLHSPDPGIRTSCIRVLMGYPLDEAIPVLLEEARSPFSPLRREALTALSFTGRGDLVPELLALWADVTDDVRPALVKALLRLDAPVTDQQIRDVWRACPRGRQADIFVGLALSRGRMPLLFELLAGELAQRPDGYWSQPLFDWMAAAVQRRASMQDIFTEENLRPGSGILHLIANYEGKWPDGVSKDTCKELILQHNYARLTALLREVAPEPWVQIYDRSSALGVLFLCLLWHDGDFAEAALGSEESLQLAADLRDDRTN